MQRKTGNDRVGSFGGQGLAPNLPPAGDVGKRNYEDRDLDIKYPPRAGDEGYKSKGGEAASGWKSTSKPSENEDVDDKWSKVFKSGGPPKKDEQRRDDQPPLKVNESRNFSSSTDGASGSRTGGSGDARNFGGNDSRTRDDRFSSFNKGSRGERGFGDRPSGDRPPYGGDRDRPPSDRGFGGDRERPSDRGGFGGDRERPSDRGGFGGDRERPSDRGGFGGDRERPSDRGGFGGDRERPSGGGFGGDRERPSDRGGFGGDRDRPSGGGFGGDRGGDRERASYGDRPSSGFGGGRGGGGGRGKREDDGEWMQDPRFASKFGGGRSEGGRRDDRRGGDRGDDNDRYAGKFGRDTNPRFADREARITGPIPTAPKSSRDSEARPDPETIRLAAEKVQKAAEEEARRVAAAKQEKVDKAAKKRAEEEEARRMKAEKELAAKAAKETAANAKSLTFAATTDSIKAGLKGKELTTTVSTTQSIVSAFGATKAILHSLNESYIATKWHESAVYGDLLKSCQPKGKEEKIQVEILYAVQEFCHEKKFPKLDAANAKSTKSLIEGLFTLLVKGEIVEIESIIAWAEDTEDFDAQGRLQAIVQTTALVSTLKESLEDEAEEDIEIDDDNLINAWDE